MRLPRGWRCVISETASGGCTGVPLDRTPCSVLTRHLLGVELVANHSDIKHGQPLRVSLGLGVIQPLVGATPEFPKRERHELESSSAQTVRMRRMMSPRLHAASMPNR